MFWFIKWCNSNNTSFVKEDLCWLNRFIMQTAFVVNSVNAVSKEGDIARKDDKGTSIVSCETFAQGSSMG